MKKEIPRPAEQPAASSAQFPEEQTSTSLSPEKSDSGEEKDSLKSRNTCKADSPGRLPMIAHASPDGTVVLKVETEEVSSDDNKGVMASAQTDFHSLVSREEAERMAEEAYLRGKAEAVEAKWAAEPSAKAAGEIASIFAGRQSVWTR